MVKQNAIKVFEEKKVRTLWDSETEEWYFSVVDVVAVLTDSDYQSARNYWKVLKNRLKKEGNESVTNCNQLKMLSSDGKYYKTDVATTQQLFRLIQSIPSPKAEPFKLWMAQVAKERLDQMQDPELSIEQAMADYKRLGYSDNWINQRLKSIEIRKELTDEWKRRGLQEGVQFATLTDTFIKVGQKNRQGIQAIQGIEERKPSGQYDQQRIGAEYVGRTIYKRNLGSYPTGNLQRT